MQPGDSRQTKETTMRGTTSYDGNLQMFCEPVHDIDMAKLRFLRWMIEQRQLEHPVAGPPAGEYADSFSAVGQDSTGDQDRS